ncbi:MAG TPA: Ig-like domain-containing protein [Bryobacteraceae bacterium]|nr:Ig-like domain-containing protein [Bryobacteraceae bacterium]
MKYSVEKILLTVGILLSAKAARAQVVASVYVTAPQVRIVSADSMQLTATARDFAGNAIPNATFQWSSNNTGVIQVDSNGNVTAGSLGIADVTASSGGRPGVIRLQVLPQRISVMPANLTIAFGSQQQYAAVAYDIHGQPIADATFAWHVLVGEGIFDSSTVPVSPGGMVNAITLGYYVVRASILYPNNSPDQFQQQFDGSTTLTIIPADYAMSTLASSSVSYPSFHILGKRGQIAMNDSGTLAFSTSLDGLTAGLMTAQAQSINALAVAGSPGLVPGSAYFDFDNVAIDSRGSVLAQASMVGAGPNLVLANQNGVTVLVTDRMAADAVLDVQVVSTNRFSLSDMGDIVLRGNFHYLGSTTNYQGLLRYSGGFLILEASSRDPLPGLNGTVSFDDQYGIDGKGVIYFSANAGSGRAIFRKTFGASPVKVLAVGDTFNGSTVGQLPQIAVASAGDLVIWGIFSNGQQFLARYAGGDISSAPQVVNINGGVSQLYAANAKSGVVLLGDAGSGFGLYRWTGSNAPPQPLLLLNAPSPAGEPVADFYSAALDASGNVYAAIRGVDTSWMLIQASPTPQLIAANGTPVATPGNLDLGPFPVPGDRSGPLHVLAGGNQPSVFQVDTQGLLPALRIGDALAGGAIYFGNNLPRKSPSGDLYVTSDSGAFHLSNTGASLLVSFPYKFPDGVTYFSPYNIAVNDYNQFSAVSNTDHGHQRLAFFDGANFNTIAYFQGAAPYTTPSPAGGVFANFKEQAVNDAGQVMVNAAVSGGPGGLFFFDGAAWQSVCPIGSCQLGGETVTGVSQLKASNSSFCALFSTGNGDSRVDCWNAGTWTSIVKRGDNTSDGTQISFVGTYDVNRRGDVAAMMYTGLNGPNVFLKTGDTGSFATVEAAMFPAPDGSYFSQIEAVDLRDDRRVFILALDFTGRVIAYEADPHF